MANQPTISPLEIVRSDIFAKINFSFEADPIIEIQVCSPQESCIRLNRFGKFNIFQGCFLQQTHEDNSGWRMDTLHFCVWWEAKKWNAFVSHTPPFIDPDVKAGDIFDITSASKQFALAGGKRHVDYERGKGYGGVIFNGWVNEESEAQSLPIYVGDVQPKPYPLPSFEHYLQEKRIVDWAISDIVYAFNEIHTSLSVLKGGEKNSSLHYFWSKDIKFWWLAKVDECYTLFLTEQERIRALDNSVDIVINDRFHEALMKLYELYHKYPAYQQVLFEENNLKDLLEEFSLRNNCALVTDAYSADVLLRSQLHHFTAKISLVNSGISRPELMERISTESNIILINETLAKLREKFVKSFGFSNPDVIQDKSLFPILRDFIGFSEEV